MDQHTFILIGRSGCGKGTQGQLLADYLKKVKPERSIFYVQTGGEFRKFIQGDSQTAKLCKVIYEGGRLAPEFLSIYMWVNVLIQGFTGAEHLMIDGTPRKYHEAGVLESIFDFYGLKNPHVIYINVSKEWASERLAARGRLDDTRDDIERRMAWFESDTKPAVDFYRDNPRYKFIEVNGEEGMQKVHENIVRQIEEGTR